MNFFLAIPLLIGFIGCALGLWFHAAHFFYAYLGAYLFILTLSIPTTRWTLRTTGIFTLLAAPLFAGWLFGKLLTPPNPLILIYLITGGLLTTAAMRGKSSHVRALTFIWAILAILLALMNHTWPWASPQWTILLVIVAVLRLTTPAISRTWAILFPLAHFADTYLRITSLKHPQRIPYGNFWIDAAATILIAMSAAALIRRKPKKGMQVRMF